MKLKDYLEDRRITYRDMESQLTAMFGGSPVHTTLKNIADGESEPKLELALMVLRWSNDAVKAHELIQDNKRRYTKSESTIYTIPLNLRDKAEEQDIPEEPIEDNIGDDEDLYDYDDLLEDL